MGFDRIDGMCSHVVNRFEIFLEHIGMLIIFGGYVLLNGGGHGDSIGPSEGQEEDVSDSCISQSIGDSGCTHEAMLLDVLAISCSSV